jgi:hypothetical protein
MKRPLVAAAIAATALSIGGVVVAGTLQYRSAPVGEFEVPARDSTAEADVKLKLSPDGQELRYDLKITEPITDVLQAHLHHGAAGSNGPIVAWLYPTDQEAVRLIPGEFDGRLARGVITEADLRADFAGDWEGFLEALENGEIYANVHTVRFPPGEIRDQVHTHGGGHD